MIADNHLTPEDRHQLKMAALTTLVTSIVAGTVTWLFEEAKRRVKKNRGDAEGDETD